MASPQITLPYHRDEWILNPDLQHLNHGAFGATPIPVFNEYQRWQRELERNPTDFFLRTSGGFIETARKTLAGYLGVDPNDLAFVTNTTSAMNMIANSIHLRSGDEIVLCNLEYGAITRIWTYFAKRYGCSLITVQIPEPFGDDAAIVSAFQQAITSRTRVLIFDHIASSSSLNFPAEELCQLARQHGIISVVDGAHAPGQIPLSLKELDADFYCGNFHKWLCAPKGSAFLAVRKERQSMIEPLVVGWGWNGDKPGANCFRDVLEWQGTRDLSAFLSVPAAIQFQQTRPWEEIRKLCHELVAEVEPELCKITKMPSLYDQSSAYCQMATVVLPPQISATEFGERLFQEHKTQVAVPDSATRPLIRVSFQAYNSREDANRLIQGFRSILK